MQYCSFTKRAIAAIFDMALVSFITMTLAPLFIDMQLIQPILEKSKVQVPIEMNELAMITQAFLVMSVISTLAYVIMDAVMPATKLMGSPGKALLKMAIVDVHGQRIGIGKSIARHAVKFVSGLMLVGFLMPLWSSQKRALHDVMSGTLVIKKRK